MNPNWKKWKAGLCVAALTGLLTAVVTLAVVKQITWQELLILLAIGMAKDALLYLQKHPIENVEFAVLVGIGLAFGLMLTGCSHFSSTQLDSIDPKTGAHTTTTKVSASTLFDSKSELAKFKASQTDKTQSTAIGSLAQESSGSNVLSTIDKALDLGLRATGVPIPATSK